MCAQADVTNLNSVLTGCPDRRCHFVHQCCISVIINIGVSIGNEPKTDTRPVWIIKAKHPGKRISADSIRPHPIADLLYSNGVFAFNAFHIGGAFRKGMAITHTLFWAVILRGFIHDTALVFPGNRLKKQPAKVGSKKPSKCLNVTALGYVSYGLVSLG